MLSLPGYSFYLYTTAADMRLSFNGLSGLIRNVMQQDPSEMGVIYVFFNQRRTQVKLMVFEGDGHALYYKRLARGTFGVPVYDSQTQSAALDKKDVMLILEGVEIRYRKRYEKEVIRKQGT